MALQEHARTRRRGQEGLTLVELMMACFVFAIGMVAILGSIVGIMNNHRVTALKHQTYVAMQNEYEATKAAIQLGGLQAPIGSYALPDLPGSTFNVQVEDPGNPGVMYTLPVNATVYQNVFGGVDPSPLEVVMVAQVPAAPGSTTLYQFQMAAVFP